MEYKHFFLRSFPLVTRIVISALLEFGPVILFLVSHNYVSIYKSTIILMIATIMSTYATFILQKRIPYVALYVAFITILFGYLTFHFQLPKFIQMRDTLFDVTSALVLLVGLRADKLVLKTAFGDIVPMPHSSWRFLSYLWTGFFIIIAVSNEVARRFLSLDHWFVFKSIILVVTTLFGIVALYVSYTKDKKM